MFVDRDLPDLIRTHIPTVWALELLLLLRRDPERVWLQHELSDELRASVPLVTSSLERFERGGLAARDEADRWRFAPAAEWLGDFTSALEREYRARPVAVINLIAAPADRIQELADAFRFTGGRR